VTWPIGVPIVRSSPRLFQGCAIHVDRVALGREVLARETDDALHEIRNAVVRAVLARRCLEDNDIADVDRPEINAEFVDQNPIADVQRWISSTSRDDEGLDRKRSDEE